MTMAKTRTAKTTEKGLGKTNKMASGYPRPKETPEQLYESAVNLVEQSQVDAALKQAQKLLSQVQNGGVSQVLPALNLLGEISVELGDAGSATTYFEKAVALDPTGTVPESAGGGAEKFFWLAQLSEEGGKESVKWYETGIQVLQAEIAALDIGNGIGGMDEDTLLITRVEKKKKLANAFCSIVEIYMTDLSWEDDAEARCETLITEAMAVEEETSPEVLQTLASVRLSQQRHEDAQAALKRSIQAWRELDPEDAAVPDFATRISLSRLLMEARLGEEAMEVLNRLVLEDDQSVEAWYLGGWCQFLAAEREGTAQDGANGNTVSSEDLDTLRRGSRHWLGTAIKLYGLLEYEDTRLLDHAQELVAGLNSIVGPEDEQAEAGEDDYDEWDGIEDGGISDDEMADA